MNGLKVATVGNPAMRVPDAKGFPLPTWMGAMPGMSAFATMMMKKEMDKLDIPPVGGFIEMIHDAGGKLYACKATVDMFHLTPGDPRSWCRPQKRPWVRHSTRSRLETRSMNITDGMACSR